LAENDRYDHFSGQLFQFDLAYIHEIVIYQEVLTALADAYSTLRKTERETPVRLWRGGFEVVLDVSLSAIRHSSIHKQHSHP
jgi:hypothetical protein